jgi:23S rRNA (adenine2503-C2)-methyltransferase
MTTKTTTAADSDGGADERGGGRILPSSNAKLKPVVEIAEIASVSRSDISDRLTLKGGGGTIKLLVTLKRDGRQVETVIIPWWNSGRDDPEGDGDGVPAEPSSAGESRCRTRTRRPSYSTLCVSSQVGCRQACSFCRTGLQGLSRSLSAEEILAQVVLAKSVIYGLDDPHQHQNHRSAALPDIGNVVFMGMGEPGDNVEAVVSAARALTHPLQFALPARRVTVSTVGPNPNSFGELIGRRCMEDGGTGRYSGDNDDDGTYSQSNDDCDTGVQLAWSVHSSRNDVRKLLVPTTRYTVEELRWGLIKTLRSRSRRQRSVLVEVTLLDSINDSVDDAAHLASFCQVIVDEVFSSKVVVNLIPWNDIGALAGPALRYRTPSTDRVREFQNALVRSGVRCYVRTTRGDDDLAACGQLATVGTTSTAAR